MLVLSRKGNESIIINGNVEVIVLGIENDTVKLGIKAPKDVSIYRMELYTAIQTSNREAAQTPISLNKLSQMLRTDKKDGDQDLPGAE